MALLQACICLPYLDVCMQWGSGKKRKKHCSVDGHECPETLEYHRPIYTRRAYLELELLAHRWINYLSLVESH